MDHEKETPFRNPWSTRFGRKSIVIAILILTTSLSGALAAVVIQERKSKKVQRVKRPQFTERDWDGVYFQNLFDEGLVGERPTAITPGQPQITQVPGEEQETAGGEFAWSKFISSETIENEVKTLQNTLIRDVTTPIKFKSDFGKVHQSFSILSMLFGVIREYDDDVRWKKFAPAAQASFERAAANSRVGTSQAYESCKRRKEDLQEMVRGGNFAGEEKPPETLDWSAVVERSPIMDRLQVAIDTLKQSTANAGDFTRNADQVRHEAEMVAAMAETLIRENMSDADDEGYAAYSKEMSKAAIQLTKAVASKDYEAASKAINMAEQSCSNCHDDWR